MISALDRKLLRSLRHMWGQAAAIALVIGCGVGTFVLSVSTHHALRDSQATYYQQTNFSQVFASLKQAPRTLEARIAEIPGVAQVETRIVRAVNLDIPGLPEPAVGRLISIPRNGEQLQNKVLMRKGRMFEPGRSGEVLASEAFTTANEFEPGATLEAVINGQLKELRIVGIVLSPEYITQMQPGSLFPDDQRFGVFWMSEDDLEAAFNMEGAFNDVTLTLMQGASEAEVIRRLDDLLSPYGGAGAYGRDNQISHRFISDEITQLRAMAIVMPSIFFGVAAFLLNMALRRIIALERDQIAALKAFGYSNWEVGLYYLKLVTIIVMGGNVFGCWMGLWMGKGMTAMYAEFYRLPLTDFQAEFSVLGIALGLSLLAAIVGIWHAVQEAVRLPPAEAMRPVAPSNYRRGLADLLARLKLIPNVARMVLREVERRPWKAFFSSLGIAFSVAIVILGSFSEDAIEFLIDFQFGLVERQDITVTLIESTSASALEEIEHLPGVILAEPLRAVACRLRHEHRHHLTAITGMESDSRLFRLINTEEETIPLPASGLIISRKLGEMLAVEAGDQMVVEVLEGQRPIRQVQVSGFVDDYMGTAAYMNIREVNRMMREGPAITGAYLQIDKQYQDVLYDELKATPRVVGVNIKTAAMESFMETVAENLLKMKAINLFFACAIAIGVVYNNARITLSERSAELGTLRVIGFTRAEISGILLGELALITLMALPLGMVLGYGLGWSMAQSMDTELYRIPFIIKPDSYAFGILIVLATSLVSGLIVRRRLDNLDLIAVLKSRT